MANILSEELNVFAPQQPKRQPVLRMIKKLGEGEFGAVFLFENTKKNCLFAVKRISVQTENENRPVKIEYLIQEGLTKRGHPNVVKTIGMRSYPQFYTLSLEYVDDGELLEKITPNVGMAKQNAKLYFRQLLDGLDFIHESGVVHRDIKPDNLLLTKSGVLKISDFGLAELYKTKEGEEKWLGTFVGTIDHAAPELVAEKLYRGPPVDVWASGIVLVTLLTGIIPWEEANRESPSYLAWLTNENLNEDLWKRMDAESITLLRKILTDDPETRVTIKQLLSESWFEEDSKNIETVNDRSLKRERDDYDSPAQQNAFEETLLTKRQRSN